MRTRKRFVLALSLLALITVGGGFFVWGLPPLRAALESDTRPRASLLIKRYPPRLFFSTVEEGSSSGDSIENYQRYLKAQVVMIKSRFVLNTALAHRGVPQLLSIKNRNHPIAWLQQILEVTNPKDTEILQVSLASGSGASGTDQAVIINAVVQAFIEDAVAGDIRRRIQRREQLRQIQASLLQQRRDSLRKLSSSVAGGDPPTGLEKDALPRLYQDLRTQRVKLRLEEAEAETLLARRKEVPGAATDQVRRKEIAQLEDRLDVLSAGQKVLDEELERLSREIRGAADQSVDLKAINDDIAQLEDTSRKVGAELEALTVELQAPPRITLMEEAIPAGP